MSLQALSFMLAAGLLAVTPGVAAAQTTHPHDGACCKTEAVLSRHDGDMLHAAG